MPRYNVSLQRLVAWQQLSNELTYNLGPDIERWIPADRRHPAQHGQHRRAADQPERHHQCAPDHPHRRRRRDGRRLFRRGSPGGGGSGGAYSGGAAGRGSITVAGDFRRILYHILKWNDFNRLVLADNLQLHGNSPFMTATYSAEVIIFPQGDNKLSPPIAAAGGGAAAPAAARRPREFRRRLEF